MSTINSAILSITRRRRVVGLTVGEIYDRLTSQYMADEGKTLPSYNSVRARVYELAKQGKLDYSKLRKDPVSQRESWTFTCS